MSHKHILIIEPDPRSRFALRAVLEDHGHRVVACASAGELPSLDSPPEVLLLDVIPPGPSISLLQQFRNLNPRIRIHYMTAYSPEDLHFPLGPAIPFVKPIDMTSLLELLDR